MRRLWDKVEKYCRAGQATDEDIKHIGRIYGWRQQHDIFISGY